MPVKLLSIAFGKFFLVQFLPFPLTDVEILQLNWVGSVETAQEIHAAVEILVPSAGHIEH